MKLKLPESMRSFFKNAPFLAAVLTVAVFLCGCEDDHSIPRNYTGQLDITVKNRTDDPISVEYYQDSPVFHDEQYDVIDEDSNLTITVYFDDSYATLIVRKGYIDKLYSLSRGNSTTLKIYNSDFY